MTELPELPRSISPADFDNQFQEPGPLSEALLAVAGQLARHHRLAGELTPLPGGSNYVVAVGPWNVIKIFPPFHHYQWEAEVQVLKALINQTLPVSLPEFRAAGELAHWAYIAMSRLDGTPLDSLLWPSLGEAVQCSLLQEIGALMRAMHNLPSTLLPLLDPPWEMFWPHQREHCLARHRRQELPAHLLAELPAWIEARIPELAEMGQRVLLTGEYTPQNLMVRQIQGQWRLTGMFDFADSMIGPARYDWLGPLCFLVQGQRQRLEAFLAGYGAQPGQHHLPDETILGLEQLNYLLLHRYSNPRLQLRLPGWAQAPGLEALAEMLWPVS